MTDTHHGQSGLALVLTADEALWEEIRELLDEEDFEARRLLEVDDIAAVANGDEPAVIIVDEVDGPDRSLEHCAAIRRRPGLNVLPIIFFSSNVDRLGVCEDDRYSNVGVTTALSKPLDSEALRNHVRSMGDTGRTLSGIRALQMPGKTILECMPDAFFTVSDKGLFEEHLGGGAGDTLLEAWRLEGQEVRRVWPEPEAAKVMQGIRRTLKTRDSAGVEINLPEPDGSGSNHYEVRILARGRKRVLMIVRNLSDGAPKALTDRYSRAASSSGVLAPRDAFMERFEALIADARLRERGAALLCIDIDHFTRINETLGRDVGDAVLEVAAQRIERCRRDTDKLARLDEAEGTGVTRISGDEFLLVLTDIESREDIDSVASRIRDAFSEPLAVRGHKLQVTPSIGIAMFPLDGEGAECLLRNARIALDEAKITGARGREFYTSTMKYRTAKRLDVEDELRWAIENDQLALRYLPRIDLASGRVAGLEALLRWIHPLRGSVPLSEVIPLAETTGLILPIGEWVVRNTCRQAADWREAGLDVPCVSVNLSRHEFTRDDLAGMVRDALAAADLEPGMLELEVTEPLLLGNRRAEAIVNELTGLGIGVVIDDFGRGHSSIAHLTRLPIKAIKIDRLFIAGADARGDKRAVCSAIIAMSRELGITVIAEGVEDAEQLDFLRRQGCDSVQGFLYTQPLPASEVPGFLAASHRNAEGSEVVDLAEIRGRIAAERGA